MDHRLEADASGLDGGLPRRVDGHLRHHSSIQRAKQAIELSRLEDPSRPGRTIEAPEQAVLEPVLDRRASEIHDARGSPCSEEQATSLFDIEERHISKTGGPRRRSEQDPGAQDLDAHPRARLAIRAVDDLEVAAPRFAVDLDRDVDRGRRDPDAHASMLRARATQIEPGLAASAAHGRRCAWKCSRFEPCAAGASDSSRREPERM